MKFDITDIKKPLLIDLYQNMLKSRMIEEKMITLLRQGKISKWFSGIGQEAISTALTIADTAAFLSKVDLGSFELSVSMCC